jgi:hypothetical protein
MRKREEKNLKIFKKSDKVVRAEFEIDDPELQKKHRGDRADAVWLRDADGMHMFMPLLYPNRADNEAYIRESFDLTAVNEYLAKKNAAREENGDDFKYTLFHVLVAAMLKAVVLRPKLNRFITNGKLYMRRELSAAFVVKKYFRDDSTEGLAFLHANVDDTFETLHEKLRALIYPVKNGAGDKSSDAMDLISKAPFPLTRAVVSVTRLLDRKGLAPEVLIGTDPAYSSVFFTNLGSIKLNCGYHHLTNWGTNSVFVVVGETKMVPYYDEKGKATMKETVELGLTIDERIADGFYYARTVDLVRKILANPEVLDLPLKTEIQ